MSDHNNSEISITTEVKLNLKKAEQKILSAKLLYDKQFYDDSASRSYYAILHAIVACLRLKNVDLGQHKHNYIINQFRTHFIDIKIFSISMHGKILNIKSSREQADYSNKFFLSKEDAKLILEDASQIVKNIREYVSLKNNK